MSKTMTVAGMTMVVTGSVRTESIRSVYVTFPHVAPPGVDFDAPHEGRKIELTSFRGGPVEVYVVDPTDGIPMYQGTVRDYFPSEEGQAWLRAAWTAGQPSKAAAASFAASCVRAA